MSKITQEKGSSEDFGDFSLTLPLGSYTMVVIGRDVLEGDAFSLTSATVAGYTSQRVRETFCPSTLRQAQGPQAQGPQGQGTPLTVWLIKKAGIVRKRDFH